jgi:hypothetical protein
MISPIYTLIFISESEKMPKKELTLSILRDRHKGIPFTKCIPESTSPSFLSKSLSLMQQ